MKYLVVSKYYDSGRVTAAINEVEDDYTPPENFEGRTINTYYDVFDTYYEAEEARAEALGA